MLAKLVTKLKEVNAIIKMLPRPKRQWRNWDMHFVNQPLPQVLPNHMDPAEDANIPAASRFAGALQCHMNAFCDKMECRSALHGDGGSGMMREDKYWSVIGWILTPPSLPSILSPRS